MTVNLTIFQHGEKLHRRENFKDHGSTPCFCSNHGSAFILKNDRKMQNSDGEMDSAIVFMVLRSAKTI